MAHSVFSFMPLLSGVMSQLPVILTVAKVGPL